ncbi:MAG: hypothetical protein LBG60_16515 [Bifidobacteriaceae bacterium]|jgi:hypothetical protein|nr:hypothetical protein [Bifidobacteriaceae bacterium]
MTATARHVSRRQPLPKGRPGPKRSRARACGGALALALGLGLGIPAAQALWWVEKSLPGPSIQLGVVAFSAGRAVPPTDPIHPLTDGTDEDNAFSTHWGYEERHEEEEGADVGTTLSRQLTEDDAEALEAGAALYIKYVVSGQAQGNSLMTYAPDLTLPVDNGNPIQVGWTANSVILLYSAGNEDPANPVSCDAAFFKQYEDGASSPTPTGIKYNGDGKAPTQVGGDPDPLVGFTEETNQQVWCLKAVPITTAHKNDALIKVATELDGLKTAKDTWTATIADRSTDAEDQVIVSFTPTVSRWEPDE